MLEDDAVLDDSAELSICFNVWLTCDSPLEAVSVEAMALATSFADDPPLEELLAELCTRLSVL